MMSNMFSDHVTENLKRTRSLKGTLRHEISPIHSDIAVISRDNNGEAIKISNTGLGGLGSATVTGILKYRQKLRDQVRDR